MILIFSIHYFNNLIDDRKNSLKTLINLDLVRTCVRRAGLGATVVEAFFFAGPPV